MHPPLHFFNGGIKAMMAVLREHVRLVKSASDSQTYLVAGDAGPAVPPMPVAADAAPVPNRAYMPAAAPAASSRWPRSTPTRLSSDGTAPACAPPRRDPAAPAITAVVCTAIIRHHGRPHLREIRQRV